jgi:hypothetical protein
MSNASKNLQPPILFNPNSEYHNSNIVSKFNVKSKHDQKSQIKISEVKFINSLELIYAADLKITPTSGLAITVGVRFQ